MKKLIKKFIKTFFKNNINSAIFIVLLIFLLVTRFYGLESKSGFGYDQVDNAWAVKNIIVDGKWPLVGMQAKGNTGFYIGPYYYYLLVPFYLSTDLDPVASGLAAGFTAIFSFFVIYFVTRSIFNEKVALIASFINVFSYYILDLDRVQWPVNFIVPISFLIIYSLFKIVSGNPRYLLLLAASFGFSLHIHFTSIFYFLLIIFTLPFIPRNKQTLKYSLYSFLIFLIFVFPIALNYTLSSTGTSVSSYLSNSFHGFHLRRFLQITGDGFIEFNAILKFGNSLLISIISFAVFLSLIIKDRKINKSYFLVYICILWVLIPWIAFATYSGELTNYYFGITRPIAIFTFSYLMCRVLLLNKIYWKFLLILIACIYSYFNISAFVKKNSVGLSEHRKDVLDKISKGQKIEFSQGNPQSYIYYFYKEYRK